MTQTERAALDRALARAERDRIQVMGCGIRKADGAQVYAVSSASQPGRWYLVAIEADGGAGRLHCDCPARSYCKHRAAVHARLCAEHAASQRVAELAHAARLTAAERERERDTAILARNNRPFSIWRAE